MTDMTKLIGRVFDSVVSNGDEVVFCENGSAVFKLKHVQDCCERVSVEEIHGDLEDLVGTPILHAEESYERGEDVDSDSSTWSFYRFATIKGHVQVRFFGTSNGYYSERASLYERGEYGFEY